MDNSFFDYRIWTISAFVFNSLLTLVFWVIYRKTSKEFSLITKKRLIVDGILFFLILLPNLLSFFGHIVNFPQLPPDTNTYYFGFFLAVLIWMLALEFYSIHLLVSSIVNIYKTIKNKAYRKKKKEFVISCLYVVFLNIYVKSLIFAILLLIINAKIHPLLYDFCGVEITNFTTMSPAFEAGIGIGETIHRVDSTGISSLGDLSEFLSLKKPNEEIAVLTDKGTYTLRLGTNPSEDSRGFFGAIFHQKFCEKK